MVKLKEIRKNLVLPLGTAIIMFFIGFILSFFLFYGMTRNSNLNKLGSIIADPLTLEADYLRIGFSEPLIIQFGLYFINFFSGNMGNSYVAFSGIPVSNIMKTIIPRTIEIFLLPVSLGIILGVILGRLLRKYSDHKIGKIIKTFIAIGIALPSFLIAIIFQIGFSSFLPTHFLHSPATPASPQITGFPLIDSLIDGNWVLTGDLALHYILPGISLMIIVIALVIRHYRASLEKYESKRSIASNISTIGVNFGLIFTSIILIEVVFNLRGFGYFLIMSLYLGDLFLSIYIITIVIIFFVIITFISNIVYSIRMPETFESYNEFFPKLNWRSPFTIIGLIFIAFVTIIAISLESFTPYGLNEITRPFISPDPPNDLPSSEHPLGTTRYGYDLLALLFWGIRFSLIVGIGATFIGLGGGLLIGFLINKLNDTGKNIAKGSMLIFYILPSSIIIILIAVLFNLNFIITMITIGIVQIPSFTKIISNALDLGANVFKSIIKYIPLQIGITLIIYESVGFLGLSDQTIVNLGAVTSSGMGAAFSVFIGFVLIPGLTIVIIVIGFILLYEGL